ncbi:MAG: macro domain-containing protein [Candidatus Eisenbacteria bacterium]|nr:macro domain-containing protein [Candidatus Eisenbacteria bacterium]
MSFHFVRTQVTIGLASAPWPEADALLLPTNDYLWMAAGSALDLRKKAGAAAETEAVRLGPLSLGEVVAAPAGDLPLAAIVHMAVAGQDLVFDPAAAARAMRAALDLAASKPWRSILVHSFLGAGKGARPQDLAPILETLVGRLLDEAPFAKVHLLARDESEQKSLHDILYRIIRQQG